MRVQKRIPLGTGLGVGLVVITLLAVGPAGAQSLPDDLGSDQAGSIVVFPKVIADGTRDTLITLTNTKNIQAFVHCEYVQGTGICELSPPGAPVFCTPETETGESSDCTALVGDFCRVEWQTSNFDLLLTRQQPTIWRVSTGRVFNASLDTSPGSECTNFFGLVGPNLVERQRCPGYFITSGSLESLNPTGNLIPPGGSPFFRGELKCFQTDGFLFPGGETPDPPGLVCGNAIKGEAIIGWDPDHPVVGPTISKYNSINFKGGSACDGDDELRLDGIEYSACPEALEFTHFGNMAVNEVVSGLSPGACDATGCRVKTEFTLVPCTELFDEEVGTRVAVQSQSVDEFETQLNSFPQTLECWANYPLDDLSAFTAGVNSGDFWKTRLGPQGNRCRAGTSNPLALPPVVCGTPLRPNDCRGEACSTDANCGTGGLCAPASGIIGVVEQFYYTDNTIPANPLTPLHFTPGNAPGTAAVSATFVNSPGSSDADVFRDGGRCRGALGQECDDDGDCASDECLTDVIQAQDIVGTQGPIPCLDGSDCPPTHSCVSGFCQPN